MDNFISPSYKTWSPEWPEDVERARSLARELAPIEVTRIDDWITSWLALHRQSMGNPRKRGSYDALNRELAVVVPELDDQGIKYLWSRLLKLYDGLNYTTFGNVMSGHFVLPVLEAVRDRLAPFGADEFLALLHYLQGSPVGPNGLLFEHIWLVERRSRFFQTVVGTRRTKALIDLLALNAVKGFHHDIKDFKKIILLGHNEDYQLIDYLSGYRVAHRQGCYAGVEFVFKQQLAGLGAGAQLMVKARIITWLDNASGKMPHQPWRDKVADLKSTVSTADLICICEWIVAHSQFEAGEGVGWGDQVYKRFLKSARWFLHPTIH